MVLVIVIYLRFLREIITEWNKTIRELTEQLAALNKTLIEHHSTTLAIYNNLRAELGGRRKADQTQPLYAPAHAYHEE